jgi:RNA polymerase sigma-70 factor, ECF subfamily
VNHEVLWRPTDDLATLLNRCGQGDEEAFVRLYDATAPRAYGLALRVVRDRQLAEDVTQEAYVELWRQSQRYDRARGSAISWLLTIVHRRAVDRIRSAEATTRREEAYFRREQATPEPDITSATALTSLEAHRARAALALLSPAQRQAISLAYFEGLTHVEVAAAVGAPLGTIKFRIRNGLLRLREALDSVASPSR